MNSFYIRRINNDTTVFNNIRDAYSEYSRCFMNIHLHVIKISFVDSCGINHSYFNELHRNLKNEDYYQDLLILKSDIENLPDDTVLWFDKPFIIENLDKTTKKFKIVQVLTNDEFKFKYNINNIIFNQTL